MRIGLLTDLDSVNARYRGIPILELAERGHDVRLAWKDGRPALEMLYGCDVVHISRYHGPETRRAVQDLLKAGAGVLWDNDDDLTTGTTKTKEAKKKGALESQKRRAEMIRMMQLAHVVTTPSEVLAGQYREWGAECVRIVGNYLPKEWAISDGVRGHGGLTVGWMAGEEHRHDLLALGLRDTLRQLLETHPTLRVVGIGIDLGLQGDRYKHHARFQYWDLAPRVAEFDVGLAPMDDIPFNRARSDVKLKEYAAAGVPWLASPVGPYVGMGEAEGGRLVTADAWFEAVDGLLRDDRTRRKLAKQGAKWVQGETLRRNLRRWETALTEARERGRRTVTG